MQLSQWANIILHTSPLDNIQGYFRVRNRLTLLVEDAKMTGSMLLTYCVTFDAHCRHPGIGKNAECVHTYTVVSVRQTAMKTSENEMSEVCKANGVTVQEVIVGKLSPMVIDSCRKLG